MPCSDQSSTNLYNRIIPTITNNNCLQADLVSAWYVLGVLTFDVIVEHWSIMATVAWSI